MFTKIKLQQKCAFNSPAQVFQQSLSLHVAEEEIKVLRKILIHIRQINLESVRYIFWGSNNKRIWK
jgi:hypothetical protein